MGQRDDKDDDGEDEFGLKSKLGDDSLTMEEIEDEDIQLLIDGELKDLERIVLSNRISRSPYAKERLEALIDQKNLLRAWWRRKM